MRRTGNPFMNTDTFRQFDQAQTNVAPMTVNGTIKKSGILLLLLMASATVGWNLPIAPLAIFSLVAGIILVFASCFKRQYSPVIAPIYSLVEGYLLGFISVVVSTSLADHKNPLYHYAVPIAALGTIVTLGVMLTLYATRIIRLSETMRSVIIGATIAVALTYLFSLIVSIFAPAFVGGLAIYNSGPIGIAFSVFVIGLAAMNFLVDFDNIERGVAARAPAYMEWYCALGLLITIVWLYFEILRLLSKLARQR